MRAMTQEILNAPAPVVVYVAPSGSYAASAGAFISYSAPIASMAPGTNIGAASPVSLGPDITAPQAPAETQPNAAEQEPGPIPSTMQVKAIEDLSAYMRSLADLNKRNGQLGVEMITKGRASFCTASTGQ